MEGGVIFSMTYAKAVQEYMKMYIGVKILLVE